MCCCRISFVINQSGLSAFMIILLRIWSLTHSALFYNKALKININFLNTLWPNNVQTVHVKMWTNHALIVKTSWRNTDQIFKLWIYQVQIVNISGTNCEHIRYKLWIYQVQIVNISGINSEQIMYKLWIYQAQIVNISGTNCEQIRYKF